MIGALMMLALASTPAPAPSADVCESLVGLTYAADGARSRGVTREQAETAASEINDPAARRAGLTVIWYVYSATADGRVHSVKLADLVRNACLAKE